MKRAVIINSILEGGDILPKQSFSCLLRA